MSKKAIRPLKDIIMICNTEPHTVTDKVIKNLANEAIAELEMVEKQPRHKPDKLPNPLNVSFGFGRMIVVAFKDKEGAGVMIKLAKTTHKINEIVTDELKEGKHFPEKDEIFLHFANTESLQVLQNALMETQQILTEFEQQPEVTDILQFLDGLKAQNPYPPNVFIEPTEDQYKRFHEILKDEGSCLDAFSGSISRHLWNVLINKIKKKVEQDELEQQPVPKCKTCGGSKEIPSHDGKPCSRACQCHITHPCEKCGRRWPVVKIPCPDCQQPEPIEPYGLKADRFFSCRLVARDAQSVRVTWRFDEQQADPPHHNFDSKRFLQQLQNLLQEHGCQAARIKEFEKQSEPTDIWKKGNTPEASEWYLVKYQSEDKPPILCYEKLWFNPEATPHWWYQTGFSSMSWRWPEKITHYIKIKEIFDVIDRQAAEIKQLKKDLLEYGRHKKDCHPSPAENDCNCGFLQALKGE